VVSSDSVSLPHLKCSYHTRASRTMTIFLPPSPAHTLLFRPLLLLKGLQIAGGWFRSLDHWGLKFEPVLSGYQAETLVYNRLGLAGPGIQELSREVWV
jgi:hypothetical protein